MADKFEYMQQEMSIAMKTTSAHLFAHRRETSRDIVFLENKNTFDRIVQTYSPSLLHAALRITHDTPAAEDIVQEAFLRLWQQRNSLTPDNLGGWLYRVVIRLAYKQLQREQRQSRLVEHLKAGKQVHCTNTEKQLIQKEQTALFHAILDKLPEKQRLVYYLSREQGLRRQEIASYLKVSPNTVKVHLLRAMQFVKEHMVSFSFFFLFFVLNQIFFNTSNTIVPLRDLYKVKETIKKHLPNAQCSSTQLVVQVHS